MIYGFYVTGGLYTDPLDSPGSIVLEMITGTLYTIYSYIYTQDLFSVDSQLASRTPFTPDRFMRFVAGLSHSRLTRCQRVDDTACHGRHSRVPD